MSSLTGATQTHWQQQVSSYEETMSSSNTNTTLSSNEDDLQLMDSLWVDDYPYNDSLSSSDELGSTDELPLTNQADPIALILPRITAFISILGVICVALEAFKDLQENKHNNNNGNPINTNNTATTGRRPTRRSSSNGGKTTRQINAITVSHIQLCYQVALFCYAFAFMLGSTPAPADLGIWGAIGNQATCTFVGLLFQFGMFASIMWDMALSMTFWRMVANTSDDTRRRRRRSWCVRWFCRKSNNNNNNNNTAAASNKKPYKWMWHFLIWPLALAVSIVPLVVGNGDLYNFNVNVCWINEYPNDCHMLDDRDCLRGESAELWTNLASFVAVLHLIYSIGIMIALYCSIRHLERTMEERLQQRRGSSSGMTVVTSSTAASTNTARRQYSRKIAIQGVLYASGMTITMLPTAIMVLLANLADYWSFGLATFCLIMVPLTGYINFLVYMRNRSNEQCHTRYAKFLHRIHYGDKGVAYWCGMLVAWITKLICWLPNYCKEYDFDNIVIHFCCIRCHCSMRNGGARGQQGGKGSKGDNKNEDYETEDPTNSTHDVTANTPAHNNKSNQKQKADRTCSLPSIQEDENSYHVRDMAAQEVTAAAPATTTNKKGNKFTGFFIKVKNQNRRLFPSQWISELGASRNSYDDEEEDWSESSESSESESSCSQELDCELNDSHRDMAPPCKPVRCVSEVEANINHGRHHGNTAEESLRSSSKSAPPMMPMRFVSELEPNNNSSNDNCMSDLAPPCKPVRCVSEVEPINDGHGRHGNIAEENLRSSSKSAPPMMPMRFVSELEPSNHNADDGIVPLFVEEEEKPPQVPQRYISEVVDEFDDDVEDDTYHGDEEECTPPPPPLAQRPCHASEVEQPTIPQRVEDKLAALPFVAEPPPTMPQRFVSEVEEPNDIVPIHQSYPPPMPQRFISEMEMLDDSLSSTMGPDVV